MSGMASESGFRESIVKEAISTVDFRGAVALVGILFEHRIILSKTVSRSLRQYSQTFELEPLEPQSGADLVASLYGLEPDQLFLAFQDQWAAMKTSPIVKGLKASIQSHEHVEALKIW